MDGKHCQDTIVVDIFVKFKKYIGLAKVDRVSEALWVFGGF